MSIANDAMLMRTLVTGAIGIVTTSTDDLSPTRGTVSVLDLAIFFVWKSMLTNMGTFFNHHPKKHLLNFLNTICNVLKKLLLTASPPVVVSHLLVCQSNV